MEMKPTMIALAIGTVRIKVKTKEEEKKGRKTKKKRNAFFSIIESTEYHIETQTYTKTVNLV